MQARGFTLIELLVVMAVMAILAALAMPGYQDAMRRAGRLDARLSLLRIQYLQEKHFAEHNAYAASLAELDGAPRDAGEYLLELAGDASGQGYVATAQARPGGRQARDLPCLWLSMDDKGRRRSASSGAGWRDDDPHRCWG